MVTKHNIFRRPGLRVARKTGLFALTALLAVMSVAILAGPFATPRRAVYAATLHGNEPWLMINCIESEVREGESFWVEVQKKYDSEWPHETMKVFWYTEEITADESDYEPVNGSRQASNGYQSKHGRMGRQFHTSDDLYPEDDETYMIRFLNAVSKGTHGECKITIKDNDGVGIYRLEITSVPKELPAASEDGAAPVAYTVGDVIEITARFTGDVTNVDPNTGEVADYGGLYLQVGENRRIARLLSGEGADRLVFGYTVQEDDLDSDGISVEGGGPGTGMYYSADNRDGGLWSVDTNGGRLTRIFHGLDDDPEHVVLQVEVEEPTITRRPTDTVNPDLSFENSIVLNIRDGLVQTFDGELTAEDNGRDTFSFDAEESKNYIIELRDRLEFTRISDYPWGGHVASVPGHLEDPSILELLDEGGERVMGERDQTGIVANFARAFFVPDEDGTYHVAVGAGAKDRDGAGFYTLSIRADDHADDHGTDPDVILRPGDSVAARIDRDVASDDPGLNPWDWIVDDGEGTPTFGLESQDDRDVFRLEADVASDYEVSVSNAPEGVGIWRVWDDGGRTVEVNASPVNRLELKLDSGTYYVEVGTPYMSEGSTGTYTLTFVDMCGNPSQEYASD